jgi:hypothetical protein
MELWTLEALPRGRAHLLTASTDLYHVHQDGNERYCTLHDGSYCCNDCSASVKINTPIEQLPDLLTALERADRVKHAIVTSHLEPDVLFQLANCDPVDAAVQASLWTERAKLRHPLVVALAA